MCPVSCRFSRYIARRLDSEVSIFVESLGLTAVNSVVICEFVESIEFTAEYTTHNIRMAFAIESSSSSVDISVKKYKTECADTFSLNLDERNTLKHPRFASGLFNTLNKLHNLSIYS